MLLVSDNFKSQGIGIDPSMFVLQHEEPDLTTNTRRGAAVEEYDVDNSSEMWLLWKSEMQQ